MKKQTSMAQRILIAALLLFVLFLFSSCAAVFLQFSDMEVASGSVAIIPIHGAIVASGDTFGASVSADEIIELLEEAKEDDNIEAVILEINSPGGSPVASDEIGRAVQDLRAANKTVVAWMREVAASGGYWIASNADHIIANRMTITGSIGVTASSFGFEEFIDDHNITYRQLTSGENKEIGNPFVAMSVKDKAFLQEKIDGIHWYFIDEVSRNRNMTFEEVQALATGEFFLGYEALDAGLVDELGGLPEAKAYLESQGIDVETFPLEAQKSFWQELTRVQVTFDTPLQNQLKI